MSNMLCRVAMLEEELGRMNPDMTAIAAFQAKEAEYAQRVSDLEAATAERDNVGTHQDVAKVVLCSVVSQHSTGCLWKSWLSCYV